jgi:GTP cyclohydrolase I
MGIAYILQNRLITKKLPYGASDNISNVLEEGDLEQLKRELVFEFNRVLDGLVIDRNDPNSRDTAERLSKMYVDEIMSGRYTEKPDITSFPNEGDFRYYGMLVVRAEIKSVCAHHHQPVTGTCYMGILPGREVIGLSKYVRLAQWYAKRGTLQEELTNKIAYGIIAATGGLDHDVAVHIRAEHGCMTNRGVDAHSALTQTTVLLGQFKEADVKKEFFDNIAMQV